MEKLESYVIDNALKEKIVADFKEQVESVNDALERLKAEDIPCDLPTLKKIMSSDESFKKWLVKAEDEFIGKLGFLPMEERKRIGVSFANVFKRTANDRNTVASFLSDPKYPIVQGKDGSLQYDWQEVEKGAEQRATRHFTDEDRRVFRDAPQGRGIAGRLGGMGDRACVLSLQGLVDPLRAFEIRQYMGRQS